jgi:hypothetical protein
MMGNRPNDWIDEDEAEEIVPPRKRQPNGKLAEDLDPEELDEWGRERGDRGRKPADKKHRRPKPDFDAEV